MRLAVELQAERARTDLLAERIELLSEEIERLRSRRDRRPGPQPTFPDGMIDTSGELPTLKRSLLPETSLWQNLRVVPHRDGDGAFDGFRVFGLRPRSAMAQLGLNNGDVLHAINGSPLAMDEGIGGSMASMFDADRVQMALTRRGERIDVAFLVVD